MMESTDATRVRGAAATRADADERPGRYDFRAIEARWQAYWEEHQTFRTLNPGEPGFDATRPKFYILDMFPYPSGAGLHVGHPLGYCATDIVARFRRMRGFNVLHPMGFDAFGLPAEQYAVETGVHPAVTTKKNIEMYRRQLKMFGFSYDWSRELATSDPEYYRWTQWMFTRMYDSWYDAECQWTDTSGRRLRGRARPIRELEAELESGRLRVASDGRLLPTSPVLKSQISNTHSGDVSADELRKWADLSEPERRRVLDSRRLAFMDEVPVNWCPALGTVLANEEVDNEGRSERGHHPVYRRPLKQWMLRITCYAERLIADLEGLDWPEPIKLMQRNWIGRSEGAEVLFPIAPPTALPPIRIYTTRPDTLFGATYMVLAPEHPLVVSLTTGERRKEVSAYVAASRNRSDLERTAETKEKTGVFTGSYAINPVNGCRIPIWVADYVLMGYGTGAIMAVPGSDTRDFEFAFKFDLPIVAVVRPTLEWLGQRVAALAKAGAAEPTRNEWAHAFPEFATGGVPPNAKDFDRLIEHYVRQPKLWGAAFIEEGQAVNSPAEQSGDFGSANGGPPADVCHLNGLPTPEAKETIIRWLEAKGIGSRRINFKLRDWLFSRQRYWGEPFPVLHGDDGSTRVLADDELPLELPPMADFKPTPAADEAHSLPEPPLGRAKAWGVVEKNGKRFRRDLNTMPQWAGSCWYYLRFIDPRNAHRFCDARAESYWNPVDLYVGGAEHAVLHLLYARFWHKVLYDLGFVTNPEPFQMLFNQGMIQSFAYEDGRGMKHGPAAVEARGENDFVLKGTGERVNRIVAKMAKSLKNVVNPDEVIDEYGADTFRLYEMYMGPLDAAKPWNTRDVPGLFKLCQRIWRLIVDEETNGLSKAIVQDKPDEDSLRALHKMTRRVTEDLESMKFNTAIAAMFDFVNFMTPRERRPKAILESFVLVLAPFAPHLGEELWNRLGQGSSLAYAAWPAFDPALARDATVEVAVQVNGKIRARLMLDPDADESAIEAAALADDAIKEATKGKSIKKIVVVKGRLVSIVVH